MAKIGRSRLPLVAAGVLALVALAAFLILDLAGGSVDPSSLPVVEIGRSGAGPAGQGSGQQGQGRQGQGSGGTASTTAPGTTQGQSPQTKGSAATAPSTGATTHRRHGPRDGKWWGSYRRHGRGWRHRRDRRRQQRGRSALD